MQVSLRVICNRSLLETVKQRIAALTNYLCLSDRCTFSPYWKDDKCVVWELNTQIENPDYSKIQQYIRFISNAKELSQSYSPDEWESAYFASLDELHSGKDIAFVMCNII